MKTSANTASLPTLSERHWLRIASLVWLGLNLACPVRCPAEALSTEEFISDNSELIAGSNQAWGELGLNTAAHEAGQTGAPLQIRDNLFAKGLGHHATGSISVLLDGRYSAFEAEVGLQPCAGGGSVRFRILVDGTPRFQSDILRATNAAVPVHVQIDGATELKLEALDAGDGITCDMANWANARLIRAPRRAEVAPEREVDMAPFARLVTWDPNRTTGCRSSRVEEFRADDLFTETELKARADGTWLVTPSTNGLACIGLQWLNRRTLKQLEILFPTNAACPRALEMRLEGWFGESAWQGAWKKLEGEFTQADHRITFRVPAKDGMVQTQKIRWIIPTKIPLPVGRLAAFTRSRWQTTKLVVETGKPANGSRGNISLLNGEWLEPKASGTSLSCKFSDSLPLAIWSSRPSPFKSDPTILQFHTRAGSFGVSVNDVLDRGCVYLPQYGVLVTTNGSPITLANYRESLAGRKTILEQVRELPDQTLHQAMASTHHDAQREGPVMLSLACDNTKFVLDRDGTLRFQGTTNLSGDWMASAGRIAIPFGMEQTLTRSLDGGWLPAPIIVRQDKGFVLRQRTFVAPVDDSVQNQATLGRPSVCVLEFAVSNTQPQAASVSLQLEFHGGPPGTPIELPTTLSQPFPLANSGLQARVLCGATNALAPQAEGHALKFSGILQPAGTDSFQLYLAVTEVNLAGLPDSVKLWAAFERYWNGALAPAAQVTTPDPLLDDLIRSSQVRCLIAARNEDHYARIAPWIAAMSYGPLESESHSVLRGMDFMGHEDFAQRGLDFFIERYNTNGFLTTGYTTFGTAWHLWTVAEHCQLYQDRAWLRQAAPQLKRVGDWIVRQTQKTKVPGTAAYGLMPPGVLADWNAFAYHFTLSAYYYAALSRLGSVLEAAGDARGKFYRRQADELQKNILRAYRWTQSQSPALALQNGTWIPHYPSQVHSPGKLADFFPGQDAGRSWCYDVELGAHQLVPTGVLPPQSPEVERMLDHMEDVQFLADGWFDYPASLNEQDWYNLGGFSKVQPYYTRNCEIYALRDEAKPFIRSYFNTIAAMLNPEVLTFWEHFNHSGAWDKTHETGYFLHQTRLMLLNDDGPDLWLAPLITTNWLAQGQKLEVKNAPTRFGRVSYRIESNIAAGCIFAHVTPPDRARPRQIVLRLRHPGQKTIEAVFVNGRRQSNFDPSRELVRIRPSSAASVEVQVRYR